MNKDEDRTLGFLISDAARLMRTVFDRRVRKLGLTRAQWLVLARLNRRPGASQSELADMMEVEKASAGRMVDRLERKGWVERRPDPVDRRINRLYLTTEAEKISQRMKAVAEQTVGDALSDLTSKQADQLADLMATVKARLAALAAIAEPTERSTEPRGNGAFRSNIRRKPARAAVDISTAASDRGDGLSREMADGSRSSTDQTVIAGRSAP